MNWTDVVRDGFKQWEDNKSLSDPQILMMQYGFEWGTISALHLTNNLTFHQKNELIAELNALLKEHTRKNAQEERK